MVAAGVQGAPISPSPIEEAGPEQGRETGLHTGVTGIEPLQDESIAPGRNSGAAFLVLRAQQEHAPSSQFNVEGPLPPLDGSSPSTSIAMLSPEQQAMVTEIRQAIPSASQELDELMQRTLPNGTNALLDADASGRTLLETLHELATTDSVSVLRDNDNGLVREELHGVIQERQDEMVESLVALLGSPNTETSQKSFATCAVTEVQWKLATYNPAEVARIVAGIASEEGSVLLADGRSTAERATARDGSIVFDEQLRSPEESRTLAQQLFQGAYMRYAVGTNGFEYDAANDIGYGENAGFRGLAKDMKELAAEAFTGRYATRLDAAGSSGTELLEEIDSRLQRGETSLVEIAWAQRGNMHEHHEVTVVDVDHAKGVVLFHNPQGASAADRDGDRYEPPPRTVVFRDGENHSIESMSIEEFSNRLDSVLVFDKNSEIGVTEFPPGYLPPNFNRIQVEGYEMPITVYHSVERGENVSGDQRSGLSASSYEERDSRDKEGRLRHESVQGVIAGVGSGASSASQGDDLLESLAAYYAGVKGKGAQQRGVDVDGGLADISPQEPKERKENDSHEISPW